MRASLCSMCRPYIVEQLLKRSAFLCKLPDSEVVACGSNKIWTVALLVWNEHNLGCRVGVLELKLAVGAKFACLIIHCKRKVAKNQALKLQSCKVQATGMCTIYV